MPSADTLDICFRTVAVRGHDLFVKTLAPPGPTPPGPTLVFLHEGLGCIEFWREFPEALVQKTGLSALVYDRKGYGRSSAAKAPRHYDYLHREAQEDLPDLLDALSISEALPVGHSDGGTIALLFASAFPDRLTAGVTLAAHVFVETAAIAGIRDAADRYRSGDLKKRLTKYHGEKTSWVFHAWADTWLSDGFSSWNIEGVLPGIQCPFLIVQGEDDPYGGGAQVAAILKGMGPSAMPRFFADCGHAPHLEKPGPTLDAVCDFIRRHVCI